MSLINVERVRLAANVASKNFAAHKLTTSKCAVRAIMKCKIIVDCTFFTPTFKWHSSCVFLVLQINFLINTLFVA